MSHQPFETWLFQDEPLSQEQSDALRIHLDQCHHCEQLLKAWKGLAWQLDRSEMVGPKPGFVQRWKTRLEVERRRQHRQQSFYFLGFSLAAAGVLGFGLIQYLLPFILSPGLLVWNLLYQLLPLLEFFDILKDGILTVVLSFSNGMKISPIWLFFVIGLVVELAVLWFVSLKKFAHFRQAQRRF
jgi:hypothetical protein